jgi:hypothetical protein
MTRKQVKTDALPLFKTPYNARLRIIEQHNFSALGALELKLVRRGEHSSPFLKELRTDQGKATRTSL